MRHTEVSETPAEVGDNGHSGHAVAVAVFHQAQEARGIGDALSAQSAVEIAADADIRDDRDSQDGDEHEDALDEVGEADRFEAAQQGVYQDYNSGYDQTDHVSCFVLGAGAEHVGEELGSRGESRGGVYREEYDNDDGGYYLEYASLVVEAVLKEAGDSQRVVGDYRILSEPSGHDEPVEDGSDQQTYGDPYLACAGYIDSAGQTHQQPAAHIRGLCREGGGP